MAHFLGLTGQSRAQDPGRKLRAEGALAWAGVRMLVALAAFYTAFRGVLLFEDRLHITRGIIYIIVAVIMLVAATWRAPTMSTVDDEDATAAPSDDAREGAGRWALIRRRVPSWGPLAWWGLLVAAIGLGFAFRLYLIASEPFGIWWDEAQIGLIARQMLDDSSFRPIFIDARQPLPALFFYVFAAAVKVLGMSVTSLRAVTTGAGILTVIMLYLLARELFDHRVAVIATFFLAVMRWHVNFSRFAVHGIFAPLFMIATFYFLVRGLKGKGTWNFLVAGVMAGVGLQSYFSFLLVPLVVGLFLLHHTVFQRVLPWRRLVLGVGAFALVAALVYAPVAVWVLQNRDEFSDRAETVSITKGRSAGEVADVVFDSTKTHLLMFNSFGDSNGRHNLPGAPMLDTYTGFLFVLGAGYALWRWRDPGHFLLLAWVAVILQGGIWSDGPPQAYRTLGVTPAIAMLAALPLGLLWRLATGRTEGTTPEARPWSTRFGSYALVGVAAAVTLFSLGRAGYLNFDKYFNEQLERPDVWAAFGAAPTIVGHEVNRLRPENYQFFISTTFVNDPARFFLNGPETDDIANFDTGRQIPVSDLRPTVFFHDALEEAQFLRLRSMYPDGEFIEHRGPGGGGAAVYETILDIDDVSSLMGIRAVYTGTNGQRVERLETQVDADVAGNGPVELPFQVAWSGFITLPDYGEYLLGLRVPGHGRIVLDGEPLAEGDGTLEGRALLFQGAHRIEIEADVREAGPVQLYWQQPSGQTAELVPPSHLFWSPSVYWGLRASFYQGVEFEGQPVLERLDPFVSFRYGGDLPVGGPFSVRWKGKLLVPLSGAYGMRLSTIGDGRLLIDGTPIVTSVHGRHDERVVSLTAGAHDIEVLFSNSIGNAQVFLSWRPPDGEWAYIPAQNFALR